MPQFCTILVQSKSFRCNTSEPPPLCCKQRTFAIPKSFKCNTYKKHRGVGGAPIYAFPYFPTSLLRYLVSSADGKRVGRYNGLPIQKEPSLMQYRKFGRSEQILAKVLRANAGKKLYVATKIPPKNLTWPSRRDFTLDDCYPPDHIEEYVNKSLANLGVEKLDLIQFHTWEDRWINDERLPRAVEKLRSSGKAEAVGVSVNRWEPCNGIRAVLEGVADAVQVIYNIFDQNPEDALFPICRMKNVAVIARVPFDEGTLTGTLTVDSKWPQGDWRNTYFVPENLKNSVAHAEALRPLVPAGNTMAQMALRFILNNPDVSTIIPGMRKRRNVEANIAASAQGPLPAPLHKQLRAHPRGPHPPTPGQRKKDTK